MEENLDRLYSLYYDAVSKSCHLFGMDDGAPFTLEEFIHQNQTLGFPICLIFMIFFYDPVGREPNMHLRLQWLIKMCMKHSPKLFY